MRVLLSAYACRPDWGSEPGFGWNWAIHLANLGISITVFTREDFREYIEEKLSTNPVSNLTFEYIKPSLKALKPTSALHYLAWQLSAVKHARAIHRQRPFDVIHHVTYGSVHIPTFLWSLGVPTIWGPVGGGQTAPKQLLPYLGPAQKSERVRTLFTNLLRYSIVHRFCIRRINTVFAANEDTLKLLQKMGRADAALKFDVGISSGYRSDQPKFFEERSGPVRLIWVARLLPRKGLSLALDVIASTRVPVTLTVVGNGMPEAAVRAMISERGIEDKVSWSNERISLDRVRQAYRDHDALLFTSIRETCGVQLLEAMSVGLPIITMDLHGAKTLIPDKGGFKIPVTTPSSIVANMAAAIEQFAAATPLQKSEMSKVNWQFAARCTWDSYAEQAVALYKELLVKPSPRRID